MDGYLGAYMISMFRPCSTTGGYDKHYWDCRHALKHRCHAKVLTVAGSAITKGLVLGRDASADALNALVAEFKSLPYTTGSLHSSNYDNFRLMSLWDNPNYHGSLKLEALNICQSYQAALAPLHTSSPEFTHILARFSDFYSQVGYFIVSTGVP